MGGEARARAGMPARRGEDELSSGVVARSSIVTSDDPDELFDLVDMQDQVIGQVRRGEAHRNPALLHRSVQILVFDGKGRVLLQRRSHTKDLFPGYYCASASGHVASGEEYAATAQREIAEELGVSPQLHFVGTTLVRSQPETELTALFLARHNGPFQFSPTETQGGMFFTLEEMRALRRDHSLPLTPAAEVAFDEIDRLEREGQLAAYLSGEPPSATETG